MKNENEPARALWTPQGRLLCYSCAGHCWAGDGWKEETLVECPCDSCGTPTLTTEDLALEGEVVRRCKALGMEANRAQTGGMCSAAEISLGGGRYILASTLSGPLLLGLYLEEDSEGEEYYDPAGLDDAISRIQAWHAEHVAPAAYTGAMIIQEIRQEYDALEDEDCTFEDYLEDVLEDHIRDHYLDLTSRDDGPWARIHIAKVEQYLSRVIYGKEL